MMFEGDDALKKISILSGGEKSRVLLGKLIATPVNLLFLDEPTNHLDMESSDALLAALDNFEGAVVMVTHNEMFLDALAERLIVFQGGGISVFEGTYQRFLESVGWQDEAERPGGKDAATRMSAAAEKLGKKEMRKRRSELLAERSRQMRPLESRMAALEKAIEDGEAELARLNQAAIEASLEKDGVRIEEISKTIHQLRQDIDRNLAELEPVLREYEMRKNEFAQKLGELEERE